jgi:hypothetical protein
MHRKTSKLLSFVILTIASICIGGLVWFSDARNEDLKRLSPNIESRILNPRFASEPIDNVLNYYMVNTGITILKNPKIETKVSIFGSSMNGIQAIDALSKSLESSNLELQITEKFIVIDFKKPKEVKEEIIPITAKVYDLKHYSSSALVQIMNSLFLLNPERSYSEKDLTGRDIPYVAVYATEKNHKKVEQLIKELDVPLKITQTKVFKLKYSSSTDLVSVLSIVLSNYNKPVAVLDNIPTNSLIITGSNSDLVLAEYIIKSIDIPTLIYDKATILQLKNSKVEDIVKLINQLVNGR